MLLCYHATGNHSRSCVHPRSCPDSWRGKETSCLWGHQPGSWHFLYSPGFRDTRVAKCLGISLPVSIFGVPHLLEEKCQSMDLLHLNSCSTPRWFCCLLIVSLMFMYFLLFMCFPLVTLFVSTWFLLCLVLLSDCLFSCVSQCLLEDSIQLYSSPCWTF